MKHFCGVQNREVNTWEVVSHKKECTAGKREGKRKKTELEKVTEKGKRLWEKKSLTV